MSLYIRIAGSWKRITNIYRKISSVWTEMREGHVRVSGVWEEFHLPVLSVTVTVSDDNIDLYVEAGSPSYPVYAEITIDSGVVIGSVDTAIAAVVLGSWPAGSTIKLINNGYILGMGGAGGVGMYLYPDISTLVDAAAGADGGPAIVLNQSIEIDNTNGYIWSGGGGGGGGGRAATVCTEWGGHGGGGAGGGAGGDYPVEPYSPPTGNPAHVAAGGNGTSGSGGAGGAASDSPDTCTSPINGGIGGNGGAYGSAGAAGSAGTGGAVNGSGAAGGNPGKAIDLQGYSVTWLGGNNPTQVKGAVS